MQKIILALCVAFLLSLTANAQSSNTPTTSTTAQTTETKPKKVSFRSTKDQMMQAQKALKEKGLYVGEATGKSDPATKDSIKQFQAANGLKQTGSLNRSTLEKMNIALTDKQKTIPASEKEIATAKDASSTTKKRGPVFRATKDQVTEAQTKMKAAGIYAGELTGKLDDDTRASIRKFQETNGVKVTGTLNAVTLEKMKIALTDKQKEQAMSATN